jgi:hypothetical protein
MIAQGRLAYRPEAKRIGFTSRRQRCLTMTSPTWAGKDPSGILQIRARFTLSAAAWTGDAIRDIRRFRFEPISITKDAFHGEWNYTIGRNMD